jgi:hypothetical protein
MSNSNLLQHDATAWLLAIGQRLRVEYEDLAEPMPPRLTALLKLFESAAGETVQQCSSHPMVARGAPPLRAHRTFNRCLGNTDDLQAALAAAGVALK